MRKSYRASNEEAVNRIKECLLEDRGYEQTKNHLRVNTVLGDVLVRIEHIQNQLTVEILEKPHQISEQAFFKDITERITRSNEKSKLHAQGMLPMPSVLLGRGVWGG